MKTLVDAGNALTRGLAAIRAEFQLAPAFPPHGLEAAAAAAARAPTDHVDRTDLPFITLDPAPSTDLDQAFCIEESGNDLILRYAIADVGWFVGDGDPIDVEAWQRGETIYLPDGKLGLYPPILAEGAASLLPAGPRPAVVFVVRVDPDGEVTLDGAERALIRSRAKLAYETVREGDLPAGFAPLARRIQAAEARRGAARVDPPEQEVARRADGGFHLLFRPHLPSEVDNAALSLATNLAVADALLAHQTGLFRVMAEPDAYAVRRLRHSARALGVDWPREMPLDMLEKRLDQRRPADAALMLAIRRAGTGASYAAWRPGFKPWHSAMAATYAHATAPLRRLADRYVVRAALAVANGEAVPAAVSDAFVRLPKVMARADALAGRIDRAVIDLAETVLLSGQTGREFEALVTDVDERGARIQLCDLPVISRVRAEGAAPGDRLSVRLADIDHARRALIFQRL